MCLCDQITDQVMWLANIPLHFINFRSLSTLCFLIIFRFMGWVAPTLALIGMFPSVYSTAIPLMFTHNLKGEGFSTNEMFTISRVAPVSCMMDHKYPSTAI